MDEWSAPYDGGLGMVLMSKMRAAPPSPPKPPKALEVAVAKVMSSLSFDVYTLTILIQYQVDSGLFNATYAIPRATTIPADDTEHKVRLDSNFESTF